MLTKPLCAQDFMRHEYIEWINDELRALQQMALQIYGREMPQRWMPLVDGVESRVLAADINQIELGISDLANLVQPAGMLPTRQWRGENRDDPLLDFNDVNRWFGSLALIRQAFMGRGHDLKRTGGHMAGGDILRQRIRTAI